MNRVADTQLRRDAEYCRDYRAWLMALSPEELERVQSMGLGKPDASRVSKACEFIDAAHGQTPAEMPEDDHESTIARDSMADLSEAFTAFLLWQICPTNEPSKHKLDESSIGLRAIAAIWVLRPEAVGNMSLLALSKRLGVGKSILSRYAIQFKERFGVVSRCQRSEDTRSRMRRAHAKKHAQNVEDIEQSAPSDPSRN